jgi:tetratricopeptide (TPR) repeat protein
MTNRLKSLLKFYNEDPGDPFVLYSLAQEYSSGGDLAESRKYYLLLKSVDADYIGLYYHLGKLEECDENFEKAKHVYVEGIEIAKRIRDSHAQGELEGALAMLKMQLDE